MTNVTVGHYSEEEFHKVTPENKGNRTPRWEAEPNYGLPAPGSGAWCAAPAPAGGINFPGGEGRRKLAEGLEGLPIVKPPYGVLAAIDLKNPDKLLFQVPARRHAGRDQEPPAAQGHEHPEDGPERQRRRADHQDLRGRRRSRHHDGQRRAAAHRCAPTTR